MRPTLDPGARVAIVVNPRSGSRRGRTAAEARRETVVGLFRAAGFEPDVRVTERAGHAADLARRALEAGATHLFAWGGDGTVNEVASVLAGSSATLGIIPGGSGNGLARDLGIPADPVLAVQAALAGRDASIDAGDIDGRVFVNVAGVGFDALVAQAFSRTAAGRRGFSSYLWATAREALRFSATPMVVEADGERIEARPFLVAIANGREWGNGARIAPRARPDDGRLDLVVVTTPVPVVALARAWRLYLDSFDRASCAISRTVERITITADSPVALHVDGEPAGRHASLVVQVRRGALKVRLPYGEKPAR